MAPWPRAAALLSALSLAQVAALQGCGPIPAQVDLSAPAAGGAHIIMGEPCGESTYPAALAIVLDGEQQTGGGVAIVRKPICTGALVAPDTVLTASHCLDPEALDDRDGPFVSVRYLVSFDSDLVPLASGETGALPADAIEISERILHPDYDLAAFVGVQGLGNYHDIGLAILAQEVDGVTPIAMISAAEAAQLQVGAAVEIVGWGWQQPDPPPPSGTVGQKICAPSFINELGSYEMQIGDDDSGARKCHGDSGGPTFMEIGTSSGRDVRVVGVTSHTYDAWECYRGSVDTRVDAWRDWIDSTMRERCADGTRLSCPAPEPEPEPGCACSQRPASPLAALLPLALCALRRVRRAQS